MTEGHLDKLNALLEPQFDTLLYRFRMPMEYLPPGALAQRAIVLLRYAEQQQRLPELWEMLCDLVPDPPPPAASADNPFGDIGRISDPARYFEREAVLHAVFDAVRKGVNISLLGERQSGKSSLLSAVQQRGPQRLSRDASRFVYLNLQAIHNDRDFFTALCCETGLPENLRGYKLSRALEKQAAGRPFVVGLDEIECLSAKQFTRVARDALRGFADGAASPLTLLIASRAPLDSLFPDSPLDSSPLAGICQVVELPPFTRTETMRFLERAGNAVFSDAEMEAVWQESGGHPHQVQALAAKLWKGKVSQG